MKNFSETLNLPKTKFSMKAGLTGKEPQFIKEWEKEGLYKKIRENRANAEKFIFHDGPPYANGNIHMGHALNKVLKDIITKYKTMQGFDVPYTPGWDTHGLPIELKVMEKLGSKAKTISVPELRKKCKNYALSQVKIQKDQMKRLGIICDWDKPYITLDPEFEAKELEVFKELVKNNYVFKGMKPTLWCSKCETALAEAENEYQEHRSPSIYVKFQSVNDLSDVFNTKIEKDVFYLIWTTTPWTLPANLAISLNENYNYVLVEYNDQYLILCKDLLESTFNDIGIDKDQYKIIAECKGKDLELKKYKHAFLDKELPIILGEHVTLEAGSGCVHTAPGHGQDDYVVGWKYNIGLISPVNNEGKFGKDCEFEKIRGLTTEEANKVIGEHIEKSGHLMKLGFIKHQYPHCWRCKSPLLFRATEQWFISVEKSDLREKALNAVKNVKWVPGWGENRITAMLEGRPDWCITRQRRWGVPLPIIYCKDCGKEIIDIDLIDIIIEKVRKEGSSIWYEKDIKEIIGEYSCPECGHKEFRKEQDIFDVWFDSGTSHWAVLNSYPGLKWPADLYLEGSDQHRGWFQTSLLTSMAAFGTPPYKTVLTHGFVVDGKGKKMSKSIGNTISPLEIIKQYGADILRLWIASADYKEDIRISEPIIKQAVDAYKKIRNTIRYLLGNLNDFNPKENTVSYENMTELDQWALSRLNKFVKQTTEYYEKYEFYKISQLFINFCSVEMSAFYLDVIKDRLYCSEKNDIRRRSAQTIMHELLMNIVVMMSPILSFTSEEIWKKLTDDIKTESSVHLAKWPEYNKEYINNELEDKWQKMFDIREDIQKSIEKKRSEKIIGHSLDCKVSLLCENDKVYNFIKDFPVDFSELLIISRFTVQRHNPDNTYYEKAENTEGLLIKIDKIDGDKCERCWMYSESVSGDDIKMCNRCRNVIEKEYSDFLEKEVE